MPAWIAAENKTQQQHRDQSVPLSSQELQDQETPFNRQELEQIQMLAATMNISSGNALKYYLLAERDANLAASLIFAQYEDKVIIPEFQFHFANFCS